MINTDVIILGAGASGLMCAIEAGKRGRRVIIIDHANKAGKKILMSGGGKCNFTNKHLEPRHYLSNNPHFCKSALQRFTQCDFLALVEHYQIAYHERAHGQLFCTDSAKDILAMLVNECEKAKVLMRLNSSIQTIDVIADRFVLTEGEQRYACESLVVATGGLSIPKMGATPYGYQLAEQFGIPIVPTRAGLVPFTLQPDDKARWSLLSGIAVEAIVSVGKRAFRENLLFTHRGLSGPVILQISSYWTPGQTLTINFCPDTNLTELLKNTRQQKNKQWVKTVLETCLPKRLLALLLPERVLISAIADCSDKSIQQIATLLQQCQLKPNGTEGYRTAEVTLGGVDCNALSSKTMAAHCLPNLYFIGEVVDVTGWLGGYNFQWAWSSGWCAGQYA
jgi:predicted Rossmann fold flavoprotein